MLGLAASTRFEVVRPLGRGGMGVVYEVFDREQRTICALKLLPQATPHALSRFKHEFRALQGLIHQNLIALGELLHEGDDWFFTMELIHGVDFVTWVRGGPTPPRTPPNESKTLTITQHDDARRPAPPRPVTVQLTKKYDERRLRDALVQLAEGLVFLHDAGKVHCDVKPSNVLVTDAGRVVLLDFGLVADRALAGPDSDGAMIKGTPAYMPPEQIDAARLGPAADQYALGAMLFEALTGELAFPDCSMPALLMRRTMRPPRPSELVPIPSELDDLCAALLDPCAAARPSARDVLARLGTSEIPELREPSSPFVGRAPELEALRAAYVASRGGPVVVAIEGPSGIGKTALLGELLEDLRRSLDPPLVLAGRCYEHEGIPYKAIDGVMDALAEHLGTRSREIGPALPVNAPLLGVLFPVLQRVRGFEPPRPAPDDERPDRDPHEMRRDAERALRSLMRALVSRRPVLLCIDDFQWADADSKTLLAALARAPEAPPLLLVLSSRAEVTLPFDGELRRVTLDPLSAADARALAESILTRVAGEAGVSAEAIAEEAGGYPFFVHELARRPQVRAAREADMTRPAHVRLEDVVWARIEARRGDARTLLELVAVAAAPISQSIAAEAATLDAAAFGRATQELRAERLVRTTGIRPTDDVETYHDRIRETVIAKLSSEALAARHIALARALEHQRSDDLDALATHYDGGGDAERAAAYAVRAGDAARAALAFERAASFYRRAIARLSPEVVRRDRLHFKLAESLANAGMGADAAAEFERAAAEAEPATALELRRRAADQWLATGRLDEGLATLRSVLADLGVKMPNARAATFASLTYHRARVRLRGMSFAERPATEVAPRDLLRVDTLWAATARLGAIDTIRAADFQAKHLLLCLDLGEPFRVARALLAEVSFAAMAGPRGWPRTQALLSLARALVSRIDEPYASALLHFGEGFAEFQAGRCRSAHAGLTRAAELFRTTCTAASHDVAISTRFAIDCLFAMGELAEMRRAVPSLLEDAERRGDLYLAAELRTGVPNAAWLAADRPDEARRATDRGIERWPRHGFYLQHYYHMLASARIALYLGDGATAHRVVELAWPGLRNSLLLDGVQGVRTEALYLRAGTAVACGDSGSDRIAEKMIARLDRDAVPAAPGFAAAARAGLDARRGERASARAHLASAERAFTAAGFGMFAAACRFHRGRLGRGAEAVQSATEAEAWMRARSVVVPDRFAQLLVPGMPA